VTERFFSGQLRCTEPGCNLESWNLVREGDAYKAYCHDHKPKDIYSRLEMMRCALYFPWRDVTKVTLHKLDFTKSDYKGKIITVEMKDAPNFELMRYHAVQVCQGLMLMADMSCVIHQFGEEGEQNYCFVEASYHTTSPPATCTITDKYWGQKQIGALHDTCRLMARIHEWELVDESASVLDRIVKALDNTNFAGGDSPL
jgi:hypothetical protein